MVSVSAEELEVLLLRGWRRFGPAYFRPACRPCGECVSIRLDTHRSSDAERALLGGRCGIGLEPCRGQRRDAAQHHAVTERAALCDAEHGDV